MKAELLKPRVILRAAAGLLLVVLLGWFAHANAGQPVDLRFGLFTLRDVSLPAALYGAVIVGMLLILAVSLRHDLRTRQALRRQEGKPGGPDMAGTGDEEVLKGAGQKTG